MVQSRMTMCQEIVKAQGEVLCRAQDELLLEHTLSLAYGGEQISFFCTELQLRELAVGYVFSAFGKNVAKEAYVMNKPDPCHTEISFSGEGTATRPFGRGTATCPFDRGTSDCPAGQSACAQSAGGGEDLTVEAKWIYRAMEEFSGRSELFTRTGNVHSAAFFPTGQPASLTAGHVPGEEGRVLYAEDIGRHNALDKLIGLALIRGISLSEGIVLLSGRMPSDMTGKLAAAGVVLAAGVSAPTWESVRLAQTAGMTLIGFARENRMNIYSHAYRVTGRKREDFDADEKCDFFK